MCKDSVTDEWVYVIKQGVGRALKTIKKNNRKNKQNNSLFIEMKKLFEKDVFVTENFKIKFHNYFNDYS